MTRRTWAALAAIVACAGCSAQAAPPRDDRAAVRSSIAAFGEELVRLGDIPTSPAVQISDYCPDAHWVPVQWSADLPTKPGNLAPQEIENNVIGQALLKIRLDGTRVIRTQGNVDQMEVAQTTDHATVLTVTVPRGQYVRVDGYASC